MPALYVTQRALTDNVFGTEESRKKVKWYNPADVLADFAKQSVTNILAITGTGALGSAAFGRAKFYFDLPYTQNPNLSLTAKQIQRANKFADLRVVLEEVGHDFSKIAGETTKYMSSVGAAFNYAVEQGKKDQPGFVQALSRARAGSEAAKLAAERSGRSKSKQAGAWAKGFFVGYQDSSTSYYGAIDSIPSFRGFSTGLSAFGTRFKDAKLANDVIANAKTFDQAINIMGGPTVAHEQRLRAALTSIQEMHRSKFSSYAETVSNLMGKRRSWKLCSNSKYFLRYIKTKHLQRTIKKKINF